MMILVLNESLFPDEFNRYSEVANSTISLAEFEIEVLNSINEHNKHLNVEKIVYSSIKNINGTFGSTKYTGIIGEIFELQEYNTKNKKDKKADLLIDNIEYVFKEMIYVFVSPAKEATRNALISQQIFPNVIDMLEQGLASQNYKPMNRITYFLNIIDTEITATSVINRIYSLNLMHIEVINVLKNNTIESCKNIYRYLELTGSSGGVNNCINIDITNKSVVVKANDTLIGVVSSGTGKDFHGSSEKFYWMNILPFVVGAATEGFDINIKEFSDYVNSNKTLYKPNSEKFRRFMILDHYFKKLIEER